MEVVTAWVITTSTGAKFLIPGQSLSQWGSEYIETPPFSLKIYPFYRLSRGGGGPVKAPSI